jgi:hypothetical protein
MMKRNRRIFSASAQPLRATPHMPLPSGPNNDLPGGHRARDRATCAAALAQKIAFLLSGEHLFWLNEPPKNADRSSAFPVDIRGNPKK